MNPFIQMLLMALQNDPSAFSLNAGRQFDPATLNAFQQRGFPRQPFGWWQQQGNSMGGGQFTPVPVAGVPQLTPANTPPIVHTSPVVPILSDPFQIAPTGQGTVGIPSPIMPEPRPQLTPVNPVSQGRPITRPINAGMNTAGMAPGFIGTQFGQMPVFGWGIPGVDPNISPVRNVPNSTGIRR